MQGSDPYQVQIVRDSRLPLSQLKVTLHYQPIHLHIRLPVE